MPDDRYQELLNRISELEQERDRCHARLEIDHAFVLRNGDLERYEIPMDERASFPDAVDARDATIGLVEERAEAAEAREKQLRAALDFVALMVWRTDPPNAVNKLTDGERLSAIKWHPTIKAAGEPHAELAEREARALATKEAGNG